MQKSILTLLITLTINVANSQITKGSWIVGGTASFSRLQSSSEATTQYKQTEISVSPLAGYFLKDKFAVGLTPSLTYGSNTIASSTTHIAIGPFMRYYLLKPESILNLIIESSYAYGSLSSKGQPSFNSSTFSVSGGPVIFFNSAVGLEFLLAYSTSKVAGFEGTNNNIRFGIGFQFYLEKDED